jgi:hypothetical protein
MSQTVYQRRFACPWCTGHAYQMSLPGMGKQLAQGSKSSGIIIFDLGKKSRQGETLTS